MFAFCNNPRIRNIRFNKGSLLLLVLSLVGDTRQLERWDREQESRDGKSAGRKDGKRKGSYKNMRRGGKIRPAMLEGRLPAGAGVGLFSFLSLLLLFLFSKSTCCCLGSRQCTYQSYK
ncbi:hypothetical protein LX36DRAFT_319374 [Colletotrichum falcatum]|nr:hypothetical protein LX36DRAFT_319374 [Colletotrichum falcatum]